MTERDTLVERLRRMDHDHRVLHHIGRGCYLCEAAAEIERLSSVRGGRPRGELNAHFEKMQGMCSRYLEPAIYESLNGMMAAWNDIPMRDKLFIADMIYMLDGPEQRAAQALAGPDGAEGEG